MPNFRAIKISIQKALNDTTRKIETLVSILKKNPHLKKTTQKILGKKSWQRKFLTPPPPPPPPHLWKITWLPWRLTRGHAYIYIFMHRVHIFMHRVHIFISVISFIIALTICTDSRGSAAERLDNDLEYFLSSLKKGNTLVSGLLVMISTFVAVS